jgi:hypothetical protein
MYHEKKKKPDSRNKAHIVLIFWFTTKNKKRIANTFQWPHFDEGGGCEVGVENALCWRT